METTPQPLPYLRNAVVDLTGNLTGQFSPEDWKCILQRAQTLFDEQFARTHDEQLAWQNVVRDFHSKRYWGFYPNHQPPKAAKTAPNMGVRFIWLAFLTLTVSIGSVVWLGQIYTTSQEPKDKWIFFAVLTLVVSSIAGFLWRTRKHQD